MWMLVDSCQRVGDCCVRIKQLYAQIPVQKFAFAAGIILVTGAILAQFLSGGAVPLYGVGILGGVGGLLIAAALLAQCGKKKETSKANARFFKPEEIKNLNQSCEKEGQLPLSLLEAVNALDHQKLKLLLADNELKGEKNSEGNTLFHILLGLDASSNASRLRSCAQVLADTMLDINALNSANQTPLDVFNANTSFKELDREFTAAFLRQIGAKTGAELCA